MLDEEVRIKFNLRRLPEGEEGGAERIAGKWRQVACALKQLEGMGCIPCMGDGKMGGNIAIRSGDSLLVSRSGRNPGDLNGSDFVEVTHFDPGAWCATYRSERLGIEPTSDTPLHWAALMELPLMLGLIDPPVVSVHGHALATELDAKLLGIPISTEETEFSTPSDREALLELMRGFPYPEHQIYIRRAHGFFVIAKDLKEAILISRGIISKRRSLEPSTLPSGQI